MTLENKRNYDKVHHWLSYHYGKADKCESNKCLHNSNFFSWALKHGEKYSKDRNKFIMLCYSCHTKYDSPKDKWEKIGNKLRGKKHTKNHNNKISIGLMGRKLSKETKIKISKSNVKSKITMEDRISIIKRIDERKDKSIYSVSKTISTEYSVTRQAINHIYKSRTLYE